MWQTCVLGTSRPGRFKLYAPNGDVSIMVGWLHLHYVAPPKESCRVAITNLKGEMAILNGVCVVKDEETDIVAYNPRKPPTLPPFADQNMKLLTVGEQKWLVTHPTWPKELELDWDKQSEDRGWDENDPPSQQMESV